jgi:hypothetical protein
MFGSIRKKQLNATTALAMLALVFGMTGGAWAAKKYLITSTKQISPSVLKALKVPGKNGANGTPGAAGTAGPGGPQGPAGNTGGAGTNGTNGANGTNGESVTVAKASVSECKEGGTKFSNATGAGKACNGEKGVLHAGETLAAGATETGVLAAPSTPAEIQLGGGVDGLDAVVAPISFTIRLAAAPTVHVFKKGVTPTAGSGCTGTAEAPGAESGNLCVFIADEANVEVAATYSPMPPGLETSGTTGTVLVATPTNEAKPVTVTGTWAVTG